MNFVERTFTYRNAIRQFILGWFKPSLLAAEEYRSKLNNTLQAHWPEHPIEVYELVFELWDDQTKESDDEKHDNFIVFIDNQLEVDWLHNFSLDKKEEQCISAAESIAAQRCHHLPREQVLEFRRLVGQAIVNAIRKNCPQSIKLGMQANRFLKDRTVERSRIWTLFSAHVLMFCTIAMSFFLFITITHDHPTAQIHSGFCIAAAGGLIGAYLSVIQTAGSGQWDSASGKSIHVLEVFTKLAAGSVLGGIAYVVSHSVHAPPSFRTIAPDDPSLFIFGVAAGLFERLIPRIISKYSGQEAININNNSHET